MGLLSSNPVFFQGHLIEGVPDPIKHLFGIRPVDLSRNKLDFLDKDSDMAVYQSYTKPVRMFDQIINCTLQ